MNATADVDSGLLTVTEYQSQSVKSARADIRIAIERHAFRRAGSSPLSGPIARLRREAGRLGLADDQIVVDRIKTESQGWGVVGCACAAAFLAFVIWREPVVAAVLAGVPFGLRMLGLLEGPYKASCSLRVLARDPRQASDVVNLVTATPHATLTGVEWRFDAVGPSTGWVDDCVTRANARANRLARALGVEVTGVHGYAERWTLPEGDVEPVLCAGGMQAIGPAVRDQDRGPDVSTQGETGVVVTIAYRIGRFRTASAAAA